jgi:hypothetical protein
MDLVEVEFGDCEGVTGKNLALGDSGFAGRRNSRGCASPNKRRCLLLEPDVMVINKLKEADH